MNRSVTIVTPGSFPIPAKKTSSVENSLIHQAPYLAKNIDLTILGKKFSSSPTACVLDGTSYVNFATSKADYLNRVISYYKKNPTSIIQVENRPSYILKIKRELPDAPVWLSLHSITFIQPRFIKETQLRKALGVTEYIIVNSEYVKQVLLQRFPDLENKMIVNYLGVDEKVFAPRYSLHQAELRQKELDKLKLQGKQIILYVGRLIPEKGVHHLIQAFQRLKAKQPEAVLLIVGARSYGQNKLTRYVRKLKRMSRKNSSIHFVPFTPYSVMNRWYRIADVAVVPSIGQEALGLVNLEAMSTGLPVIATKIGGIPEIIKDGKNGVLVPVENHVQHLTDALQKVLSHPSWANQLGRKGREMVENKFTWRHSAKRLSEAYRKYIRA